LTSRGRQLGAGARRSQWASPAEWTSIDRAEHWWLPQSQRRFWSVHMLGESVPKTVVRRGQKRSLDVVSTSGARQRRTSPPRRCWAGRKLVGKRTACTYQCTYFSANANPAFPGATTETNINGTEPVQGTMRLPAFAIAMSPAPPAQQASPLQYSASPEMTVQSMHADAGERLFP
jgi:hypothetical protein